MKSLNLDMLLKTPKDILVKDINQIFNNLLNEIQNYLGLEVINQNIIINITSDQKEYSEDFFSLGVKRTIINDQTQIEISEKYVKFLKFILLKEAYLIFVPYELRAKQIIQIVIHEIIESDLSKQGAINEWKALVRSNIINYDFLSSQFDKLDKFFKLEATEKTQSPTQFFFEFIHRNVTLIQDKMDDFYDLIYEEFIYKTSKSLFNDEIVETIRVLVKIFYKLKLFKNYSEFEDFFQNFKEKGLVSTNLSKRKFSENLRWINKSTIISPSFQPIYHKIGLVVAISVLKFNPILNRRDVYNIINRIPFLHFPVFSENGFSEDIYCYFILPNIYLKDLLTFIEKLNNFGYVINKECYLLKETSNFLNLNYFRECFKDLRKILNPDHKDYDIQFELRDSNLYGEPNKIIDLDLLDWIIFERIGQSSLTGFGFERREETLQKIKEELLDHIESERNLILNLKSSLNKFYTSQQLKNEFYDFLEKNKRFGFFYIYDTLNYIIKYIKLIERLIKQNPEINNLTKLHKFLELHKYSQLIEENIFFNRKNIQSIVFKELMPFFFKAVENYNTLKKKFNQFYNLFKSCRMLKIFNIDSMLEIVRNEKLIEKIFYTKEQKLRKSFEKFKPYKITNQKIDSIFIRFIDAGLIAPELIRTIITSSFAKYHPILILEDSIEVNNQIDKIIKFYPRVILYKAKSFFENKSIIILFTYFLNIKEKELFSSILYNMFNKNLISFKRYFTSGLVPFVLIKDFYDFDRDEFFYTKDLFEQSFLYIQKIVGEFHSPLRELKPNSQDKFFLKEKNFFNLVKEVEKRVAYEKYDYDINRITKLTEFHRNLDKILLNPDIYKNYQQARFFKNFIKSVKFIPNFQAFGISQYFLYIHPSSLDEIDFKHLLINNFQFIKYPTNINNTNSFLIKYLFPIDNPNMKHLNWYTKTKRIIREYCVFSIKKIYQILNFNYNIGSHGWNYDSNRFKIYMQNILFNPNYKPEFTKIRHFNIEKLSNQDIFGPNSDYFQALTDLYSLRSIDIKSYLGTRKHSIINSIKTLLNKNLIFPFISLKNFDFQDIIFIIIPNIKKELNSKIIKIFNFFNYGFINEIKGEYYIYGFNEEIKFENGIMIKLYLPQCELDEFLKLFDLLFEYLEVNQYIILTDLIKGKNLLKKIYGDLRFLEAYNPLTNLIWNEKDKIWLNHKLYNEKFEKLYPDLFYGSIRFNSNYKSKLS